MYTKKELRIRMRTYRRSLSDEWIEHHSRKIMRQIYSFTAYQRAEVVLCYIGLPGEVDTCELIQDAWMKGKTVAVPRVEDLQMEFYEIHSFSDLEEGSYGIMEPKKECRKVQYAGKAALVILPGLAFDLTGNRLGYGGGYYDRYFAKQDHLVFLAPAFEGQVVEEVPTEEHDRKVSVLVTENQIWEMEYHE